MRDGAWCVRARLEDKLYEVERYRNSGKVEIVERIVQSIEFFADGYYVKMYQLETLQRNEWSIKSKSG